MKFILLILIIGYYLFTKTINLHGRHWSTQGAISSDDGFNHWFTRGGHINKTDLIDLIDLIDLYDDRLRCADFCHLDLAKCIDIGAHTFCDCLLDLYVCEYRNECKNPGDCALMRGACKVANCGWCPTISNICNH